MSEYRTVHVAAFEINENKQSFFVARSREELDAVIHASLQRDAPSLPEPMRRASEDARARMGGTLSLLARGTAQMLYLPDRRYSVAIGLGFVRPGHPVFAIDPAPMEVFLQIGDEIDPNDERPDEAHVRYLAEFYLPESFWTRPLAWFDAEPSKRDFNILYTEPGAR